MTFDNGVLSVFRTENIAESGMMPKEELTLQSTYFYHIETLGFHRFYEAQKANQNIEAVVSIPEWADIEIHDVCQLEDGKQYEIQMVQRKTDADGLQYTSLSLERMDDDAV